MKRPNMRSAILIAAAAGLLAFLAGADLVVLLATAAATLAGGAPGAG